MTNTQTILLKCLQTAVSERQFRHVVYTSEWLGYLPFGLYHWIEVDGKDISNAFPADLDWGMKDLETLETSGMLKRIDSWTNPEDECHTRITFEVIIAEQ